MNNIRLKDLPTFIRTTGNDPNHFMLNFLIREIDRTNRASAIVINRFHALERAVVDSLSSTFIPPLYTIGPLHLMLNNQISADDKLKSIGSNLWKEDPECVDWLNSQQPNSVVYVNFGSITVMAAQQLTEFTWGLAKSEKNFLWIIRLDIVSGDIATRVHAGDQRQRGVSQLVPSRTGPEPPCDWRVLDDIH
ncbi:7-deoxyloganetin glucosyltransferase [Camellia lanceoleosa]|uniref:7-deoxyloganetin glucosyltransferase n=1 Tax=Camellia lanceoleosa TaxID=1840588 RepID=A0ACC0FY62_9ERIC|nr:7-deoxyloganetin glucosyltransferase [Camellia lanceoleosa]